MDADDSPPPRARREEEQEVAVRRDAEITKLHTAVASLVQGMPQPPTVTVTSDYLDLNEGSSGNIIGEPLQSGSCPPAPPVSPHTFPIDIKYRFQYLRYELKSSYYWGLITHSLRTRGILYWSFDQYLTRGVCRP